MSWNGFVCSSGSLDNTIIHHDVRKSNNVIKTLAIHLAEVCGLKWSPDGTQLASGGNDNKLNICNGMDEIPLFEKFDHQSAVKGEKLKINIKKLKQKIISN